MKKPLYVSLRPFVDHHVVPRPVQWAEVFGDTRPVEVEIGFGNGEYLARLSVEQPDTNFVGFEEYCERISRTLRKLSRTPGRNVRVFRLDVRPAFHYLFAQRSIRFIHCLFPPPWPKKSDIKHRLLTTDFLRLANSRLEDGGGMKVVTDFKAYALWVKEQVPGSGFELTWEDVPAKYGTKFERKWAEGGQTEFYELTLTKIQHMDVPHKEDAPVQHYTIPRFNPDNFRMTDVTEGGMAVVFKDYLYDPKQQTAMVYVLVHDEHLLQNVRVVIMKKPEGWGVHLAQGTMLMPTAGIARAVECVKQAAEQSA